MKIEVNLQGVFADEEGNEIEPSVKDEIIDQVTTRILRNIERDVANQISKALSESIDAVVKNKIAELVPNLLDQEFIPKDKWGSEQNKTTVRNQIHEEMKKQIVYEKRGYSSEKNVFSSCLDNVVERKLKEFEAEYKKQIDSIFVASAFEYAQKKLQEKLGIK